MDPALPPIPRPALDASALERARRVARVELSRPRQTWRRNALLMIGGAAAVTAVALAITFALGGWVPHAGSQLAAVGLLLGVQLTGGYAAIAPRARTSRLAAVALAFGAVAAMLLLRGAGTPSATPQWVCTVSHLGLAILPLGLLLVLMRNAAPNPSRALVGGLSVGTVGAVLGEVACGQGWRHVALYHLPAWVVVMALAWLGARVITPRSYAP